MYFDLLMAFGRIITSKVSGAAKAVLVSVAGLGDGDDTTGEGSPEEPLFGQLGIVARPRAAVSAAAATGLNPEGYTEVVAARTADGLHPLCCRDLRLNQRVNPKEGEIDVVQYGGGFVSLSDASDGKGTQVVMYAPSLNDDGTIDKAHALVMDPAAANRSISFVHALGMALLMTKEKNVILKNANGSAYIQVNDDGITFNGNTVLNGGAVFGNAPTSQPMLIASPAQFLWFAQITAAVGQLAVYVNGIAPGSVTPVAAPPPIVTTKASASP